MNYNPNQYLLSNQSALMVQTLAAATVAITSAPAKNAYFATEFNDMNSYNTGIIDQSTINENNNNNAIVNEINIPSAHHPFSGIRENIILWIIIDGFIFISIVCGNCLTIAAVQLSRRLRSVVSNLFILSLAISDLLVGLTIPYHLIFYVDESLSQSHFVCIMKFFFNIIACCVSIWNLIAIAIDRYIAIVYPLHYSRWITKRMAVIVIISGWISGIILGAIPLFWNNFKKTTECEFDKVLPKWYMVGIITPVFSLIWFCMLILYWRIWREAYKHAKQLRASICGIHEGGHSDWKSVQVVILILGCFTVCWLPYFIVACSKMFQFAANSPLVYYKAAFSLAMANSGMNPVIYAWKNRTFRRAFIHLLRCRTPDSHALIDDENARENMKRKSSSLIPSLSAPPPTPNSIISATPPPPPPPVSVTDTHRRSSLHRYHHSFNTAFPLPPPPPSPQSPEMIENDEEAMGTIEIAPKCLFATPPSPETDIENNTDDHLNNYTFLHPSMNRWHTFIKNHINTDDDMPMRNEFKNFNNNELFLHQLTTASPAESIVSAPLTPTGGNLIVNILGNLDNNSQPTDNNIINGKNYRNSTNCIIGRNSNDGSNPLITNISKMASVTLAERRLNGQTKTIPITATIPAIGNIHYVTIAINNSNDSNDVRAHFDDSQIKANNLQFNRGYSLSSSAPQFINCWNGQI